MSKKRATPPEASLITDEQLNSYPSNQKKAKIVRSKKLSKPRRPIAKIKKKSRWKKFIEVFIGEDPGLLKEYVFFDVLVPAFKNTLNEAVSGGIEMLLYGGSEGRRSRNISRRGGKSHIDYQGVFSRYEDDRDDRPRWNKASSRNRHDFDNLIFASRREAESVLGAMADMIMDYGMVSVADFYEMSGLDTEFVDNKYGWTNLRSSRVERTRNGYVIHLPSTVELN